MTRKEAIMKIKFYRNQLYNLNQLSDVEAFDIAIDAIESVLELSKMNAALTDNIDYLKEKLDELKISQWIPTKEQLPKQNICDDGYLEPSEPVLIQTINNTFYVSRYWEKYKSWSWIDIPKYIEAVAWMSLPKPYKEKLN